MKQVKQLVRDFEAQQVSGQDWHHASRLVVSCWYVMNDPLRAEERIRSGFQKVDRALGILSTTASGYHETLTLFWLAKVRALVEVCEGPDVAVLNAVVEGLSDPELVFFHYSAERIASAEARLSWLEPDRVRLPVDTLDAWQATRQAAG